VEKRGLLHNWELNKKAGFGCGVAEDYNLKRDRSQCLGKHK